MTTTTAPRISSKCRRDQHNQCSGTVSGIPCVCACNHTSAATEKAYAALCNPNSAKPAPPKVTISEHPDQAAADAAEAACVAADAALDAALADLNPNSAKPVPPKPAPAVMEQVSNYSGSQKDASGKRMRGTRPLSAPSLTITSKPQHIRPVDPQPHPAAEMFPMLDAAELAELAEDIKINGQNQLIVLWPDENGTIWLLDGRNRLAGCKLAGITPEYLVAPDDLDPYAFVMSANLRRRHLTGEQKRDLIAALIAADPARSDRSIGKTVGADGKTVAAVREELTAEIPQSDQRTGRAVKKVTPAKPAVTPPARLTAQQAGETKAQWDQRELALRMAEAEKVHAKLLAATAAAEAAVANPFADNGRSDAQRANSAAHPEKWTKADLVARRAQFRKLLSPLHDEVRTGEEVRFGINVAGGFTDEAHKARVIEGMQRAYAGYGAAIAWMTDWPAGGVAKSEPTS